MPITRLKKLRVREVSLVDKGAGKGVAVVLFKRRTDKTEAMTEASRPAFALRVPISKLEVEKRQAFGWAYVSDAGTGQIVDFDKQIVEPPDLEEAAYDFVLSSRKGGDMHERTDANDPTTTIQKSRCIESFVTTIEKQRALFAMPDLAAPIIPVGWWIGFQVDDDDTWARVKNGDLAEFSIAGSADAYEVEARQTPAAVSKERSMPVHATSALSTVVSKVRAFLKGANVEVQKDAGGYPMPMTVGEILDGREMREEMYELSDALMCSVSDITWSMIAPADKVSLLKRSVDEFSQRVSDTMSTMGEVEKRLNADALANADAVLALIEKSDEPTAKTEITKRRSDFDKAKKSAAKPATTEEKKTMPQPTTPPARSLEDILKSLPEAERATVAAQLKEAPKAEPAKDPVAEFMKGAPPELRGWFEKKEAETVEIKKQLDAATLEIEKAKDAKILDACREVAKGYKALIGEAAVDDLALTLKNLGLDTASGKAVIKSMDVAFAKAREAEKILTAELGSTRAPKEPSADSAAAKLVEIAKKMQEEAQKAGRPITFEKAHTRAMTENGRLYKQMTREAKAGALAAGASILADDLPE